MNNKRLICVAINLSLAGFSQASIAAVALDEVIVTAQKTEETIQSIPISIQALDNKMLANNSINSLADIKTLVPALKFGPYPTASENLLVTIRGIAPSALELTQDTPAAIHINGVYIARGNGLNMSVADLERVEVLRGPQGTLYGRNATAGAINMITAKPADSFSFKQQVSIAQHDHYHYLSKTSVNLPITDQLYAKISYLYDDKPGFVKNSAPNGIDIGDRNAQGARFDLRWVPANNLTIDYGFDWGHERYYSTPGQCGQVAAPSPSAVFAPAVDPSECSTSLEHSIGYYGQAPKNTIDVLGHALNIEWEVNDITLRSITAYRSFVDKYYGVTAAGGAGFTGGTFDVDLPGLVLPAQPDETKQGQFSQELQVVGDFNEQLNYNTGLYYFREHGTEQQDFSSVFMAENLPIINGNTLIGAAGTPTLPARDLRATNTSVAAFGQLTWTPPILDKNLEIIPGLRITKDKREASLFNSGTASYSYSPATNTTTLLRPAAPTVGLADGTPADFSKDFSKTTPSLTVQYHVNADMLAYAKYVKGYKSGGTAVRSSDSAAFSNGFKPEVLTSIELGVKSSWLDQRLRVNADVFQSKFTDQQISVRNLAAAAAGAAVVPYDVVNAGKSTYDGGELEIQAQLTEDLRLSANYAYLHFKYDNVKDPASGVEVSSFYHNVVPTNTYAVAADYTTDVFDFARFSANLNYSYTDRSGNYQDAYSVSSAGVATPGAATDTKQYITPSYGVWNGRIALGEIKVGPNDKGSLEVALWGKNLADKEYVSARFVTIAQAQQYVSFWGEPRTFGLDVIYRYE